MKNIFKLKRNGKRFTIVEMLIVLVFLGILGTWLFNKIVNPAGPETESNIPVHLKTYMSSLQKAFNEDITAMKPTTFKKLFTDGDTGANKQGFKGVLTQCKYEPSEFPTRIADFSDKMKVAAVGPNQADKFPIKVIESIRSVLNKIGSWRIFLVSAKKSDVIDKSVKEYRSIADYVYVVLVEHSKANLAEFSSTELNDDKDERYYNAAILDSAGNIYDAVNSKYLIRTMIGKTDSSATTFDELVPLADKIVAKVKSETTNECLGAKTSP